MIGKEKLKLLIGQNKGLIEQNRSLIAELHQSHIYIKMLLGLVTALTRHCEGGSPWQSITK